MIELFEHKEVHNQSCAAGTDCWSSCTSRLLVFSPHASRRIMDMTGWLRNDFPDNRNEQGGLLIGKYVRDAAGTLIQAEVTEVLLAETDCRFPGYIEWSAMEEIRLQQQFFQMQDELAMTNSKAAEELGIIGWWHTHPNELPVFMSATDMETQRLKYFKPEKYSVVLNPHRGTWRAFAGKDAIEVPAVMLLEADDHKRRDNTLGGNALSRRCVQNKRKKAAKKKNRKNKQKSKRRK